MAIFFFFWIEETSSNGSVDVKETILVEEKGCEAATANWMTHYYY